MIGNLEDTYSSDFIEIMTMILKIDPNQRPNFSDIQKLLDNYWNNVA